MELTDANFKEVIGADNSVVLVDFWAPWCGPCKMQGPIVEEVAEDFKGKDNITIAKLNVDENPATGQEHQILSIPTLMIFKNGEAVDTMVGLQSKEVLTQKLDQHAAA